MELTENRERMLVTVRTYPEISSKYLENVCTGAVTEAGEWRRLYPVPLRYLDQQRRFRIFDVIRVPVSRAADGRPESRKPHLPSLEILDHLDSWSSRWEWVAPTAEVSLESMQSARRTLAPVRVSKIDEMEVNRDAGEWTPAQREKLRQADLLEQRKPLEKIPFEFRVVWRDGDNVRHRSKIIAWELLETYRQYRKRYSDPIEQIRSKWMNDLFATKRDVMFFMGNLAQRRHIWMVCGWFAPPHSEVPHEPSLF